MHEDGNIIRITCTIYILELGMSQVQEEAQSSPAVYTLTNVKKVNHNESPLIMIKLS